MGNIKVFISKFVISKLRKEVAQVNFLFKKWGVAVHKRLEQEWVSHDLRGNKVECPPLKSNRDTRIFVWHSHKENEDAHVWHSHKDKGEDTQNICVTFTQMFHSEKRQKGVTVHTK